MEERKVNEKRTNVTTIVYSIAKLAEAVLKRDTENLKSIGGEHPELQTLREKCKDADAVVSTASCQALVTLVEAGVLTIPNMLSTFVAMLPYFSTHVGVTAALSQLLVLDLRMRVGPEGRYKSPFNLQSPQHPLLTVLRQGKDTWQDVINQVTFLCTHPDQLVRENSCELLHPVVLHMMCEPRPSAPAAPAYRQQLWASLLSLPDLSLVLACLPWLQEEDSSSTQPLLMQLSASLKFPQDDENRCLSRPDLSLKLVNLADTLVTRGQDPRPVLKVLDGLLAECDVFTGSCVGMILSCTITKTPAIYLPAFISTCQLVIKHQLCTHLAGQMVTASLLPWLAYPSILTAEALRDAQLLMPTVEDLANVIPTRPLFPSHSSPLAHFWVRIYSLTCHWSSDPASLCDWLARLADSPIRSECTVFLGALVIHSPHASVLTSCLSVLLALTSERPEFGTSVLTWLLFRLASEREPNNQLELLRALPLLGGQKENATLVIHTLESLRASLELRPLVLDLYLRLWRREPRCFPYLHKLLTEESPNGPSRHWDIAKAVAMREICESRPSQHGTELVPILSGILNRCVGEEGAVASLLALQAICALCRARVVDVATTWRTLAPRLARDTRVPVIKGLCEVLGLMSEIRSSNPDQVKLFREAQSKLWSYVSNNYDRDVTDAAIKALSQFSLEQLSLKVMPSCYRQGLTLPPEYAKTPIDAARKPEDVLPYIPGECWVQLLQSVPSSVPLVRSLFVGEVSLMRGALHRQPGRAEPSLPRLGLASVCLALLAHLRKHPDEACLNVLASPLPKPLPPCDWSFLSELAPQQLDLCLRVAASQASTSPSAQLVTETLVKRLSESGKSANILLGFSMLGDLCKGVSPNTLRPFLEKSLQSSLQSAQQGGDSSQFCQLMSHMRSALSREDIHEANRTLLSIILEGLLEQVGLEDEEVFSCYVASVGELSSKFLERMTSPSVWWEVCPVKLRKSVHVRSHLAMRSDSEEPLVWLNECVDAVASCPSEQPLLLTHMVTVLTAGRGLPSSRDWLLQLLGRVQAALSSKRDEAAFLTNVFSLACLVLAGHDCLAVELAESREARLELLPHALRSLLQQSAWSSVSAQIIDWLHHVVKSAVIGPQLTEALAVCLCALRHTEAMRQPGVWQRAVTV